MNKTGAIGENMAARYLRRLGYRILERNFRQKCGEIDIIAKDNECICFIEVKVRTSFLFAQPFEGVDYRKQHRIIKAARIWALKNISENTVCRFDVVSILFNENYKVIQIRLFKDAFWDDED